MGKQEPDESRKGLQNVDVDELKHLQEQESRYKIVRSTLERIATCDSPVEVFDSFLRAYSSGYEIGEALTHACHEWDC